MGGSVQAAVPLVDDKRPSRQPVGYAIGDQNNAVAMIGAGRRSKLQPRFNYQYNNDNIDIFYDVEVPAHQSVAVAHFQMRRGREGGTGAAGGVGEGEGVFEKMDRGGGGGGGGVLGGGGCGGGGAG